MVDAYESEDLTVRTWPLLTVAAVHLLLAGAALAIAWFLVIPQGTAPRSIDDYRSCATVAAAIVAGVSAVMVTVVSMLNLASQQRAAERLEQLKKVMDQRIPAYQKLYSAANYYYRMLAPLETGNFDHARMEAAEDKMKEAEPMMLFADDSFRSTWYAYWQLCRELKERVHKGVHAPDDRKKVWQAEASGLGKQSKTMEKLARSAIGI